MEGLALLPWVQARRQEQQRDGIVGASDYLSCAACMQKTTPPVRANWRCGWQSLDRDAPGFYPPGDWPVQKPSVCPGYSITLPQVLEAARASMWRGNLTQLYEGLEPTGVLMLAMDIIESNVNEVEAAMMSPNRRTS